MSTAWEAPNPAPDTRTVMVGGPRWADSATRGAAAKRVAPGPVPAGVVTRTGPAGAHAQASRPDGPLTPAGDATATGRGAEPGAASSRPAGRPPLAAVPPHAGDSAIAVGRAIPASTLRARARPNTPGRC